MPRFFFDTKNGDSHHDAEGVELMNVGAAEGEALRYMAELISEFDTSSGSMSCIVRDERQNVCVELDLVVKRNVVSSV